MVGQVFGRLTVKARAPNKGRYGAWFCVCECGAETRVITAALRSGNTRSCGCLAREMSAARVKSVVTHGHTTGGEMHPLYRRWREMRQRCNNPNAPSFKDYGGRGLKVADRWQDFVAFLEDMGPGFQPGLTLERINNDRGYEPGNVRWATYAEQSANRRNNVLYETPEGDVVVQSEAARRLGVTSMAVKRRRKLPAGWIRLGRRDS